MFSRMRADIISIHEKVYANAVDLLERRPSLGYFFAFISGSGGLTAFLDTSIKIVGLLSGVIGCVVGIYTLIIQAKRLRKLNSKTRLDGMD